MPPIFYDLSMAFRRESLMVMHNSSYDALVEKLFHLE